MLKNDLVSLRALEKEDVELLYKWENDCSIWFCSETYAPYSKYVLNQYIENSTNIFNDNQQILVIVGRMTNLPIGLIDLTEYDHYNQRASIGISINNKEKQKQHFAKNALNLIIEYSFGYLHLHQLYCNISQKNVDSINLFRSAGFVEYGILKNWKKTGVNSWEDVLIFGLINS